ncbi:MAG: tetratricopeptide repeat protein [Deltaproteobacteria bacterium]|nr:tetratricopeptide repeat protein [Deltaproteobacteria bacterium]
MTFAARRSLVIFTMRRFAGNVTRLLRTGRFRSVTKRAEGQIFGLTQLPRPVSVAPAVINRNPLRTLGKREGSLGKILATLAITSALTSGLACASRPKKDADQSYKLFQVAVSSYEANRMEAAVGELEQALKADPDNADAHNMLGIIALRQGAEYEAQVETLSCVRGNDAEMVRLDASKRFRDARNSFAKATSIRPDFAEAWNNLSVTELNLQEWDAAIEASTAALKVGTYGAPHVARGNLGWAYYKKHDLQKAWRELQDAVSRQPGFCVGRYRLAKVLVDRGQMELADEHLAAVTADAKCPIQEAFLLAGMVAEKRNDRDRALDMFARCTSLGAKSCVAGECRRYAEMIQPR